LPSLWQALESLFPCSAILNWLWRVAVQGADGQIQFEFARFSRKSLNWLRDGVCHIDRFVLVLLGSHLADRQESVVDFRLAEALSHRDDGLPDVGRMVQWIAARSSIRIASSRLVLHNEGAGRAAAEFGYRRAKRWAYANPEGLRRQHYPRSSGRLNNRSALPDTIPIAIRHRGRRVLSPLTLDQPLHAGLHT
jgi:hypothetical protein